MDRYMPVHIETNVASVFDRFAASGEVSQFIGENAMSEAADYAQRLNAATTIQERVRIINEVQRPDTSPMLPIAEDNKKDTVETVQEEEEDMKPLLCGYCDRPTGEMVPVEQVERGTCVTCMNLPDRIPIQEPEHDNEEEENYSQCPNCGETVIDVAEPATTWYHGEVDESGVARVALGNTEEDGGGSRITCSNCGYTRDDVQIEY